MVLEKAMKWAIIFRPSASLHHKAAFANAVNYLVLGNCGGFGGPSMREHLVSWSLAGENGRIEAVNLGGESLTAIYPDRSLPSAGKWDFESAIAHCDPLCFGDANQYRDRLIQILEREYCFDDDPADLEVLRGKPV